MKALPVIVFVVVAVALAKIEPGWLLPGLSCLLIGIGTGVHYAEWSRATHDVGHPFRIRKDHRKKNKNRSTTT